MKMKTKIVIAFFVIVIVPISIMGAMFGAFVTFELRDIEEAYGIQADDYSVIANSIQVFSRFSTDVYAKILDNLEESPDMFAEPNVQEELNQTLGETDSYLIVRKDDKLIYCGKEKEGELIEWYLPKYGESSRDMNGGKYVASEKSLVRGADFAFEDGSEGSIFIVTQVDKVLPQLRQLFLLIALAIIVIMVMTAALIVFWIYRSIVNPLRHLQRAVNEVKQGNLEFEIQNIDNRTEIGQLCEAFDGMRRQLKESDDEMEQHNQESRELVANISHDLKTPITSILGYIDGIREGVANTPEKIAKYRNIIYNKVLDMDRLVDRLNIYSKLDMDKIQYDFQAINVSEYFNDCVEEIGMDLQEIDIELAYYDYTDKHTLIEADPEQLKRVVNNIIGNSVKYMDKEKGFITITIKDVGNEVQVKIKDNGKGISPEELTKIFERFYRADASRSSSQGGSGIGLSIVKKIIEDHGGRVWAESKEKKGTMIFFTLRKCDEEDVVTELP